VTITDLTARVSSHISIGYVKYIEIGHPISNSADVTPNI
jgi:hypothetical protein